MANKKNSLNREDWKSWAENFLRYVVLPTLVAFLGAYTLNFDTKYAVGVAGVTLFNSAQNLFNKWKAK